MWLILDSKPRSFDADSCTILCKSAEIVVRDTELYTALAAESAALQVQKLSRHHIRLFVHCDPFCCPTLFEFVTFHAFPLPAVHVLSTVHGMHVNGTMKQSEWWRIDAVGRIQTRQKGASCGSVLGGNALCHMQQRNAVRDRYLTCCLASPTGAAAPGPPCCGVADASTGPSTGGPAWAPLCLQVLR